MQPRTRVLDRQHAGRGALIDLPDEERAPRAWWNWLLALAALAWLGFAVFLLMRASALDRLPPLEDAFFWLWQVAGLTAPLLLLGIAALLLRRQLRPTTGLLEQAATASVSLKSELARLDALVAETAARIETMRTALGGEAETLADHARRLSAAASEAGESGRAAAAAADLLAARLPEAGRQLEALKEGLAATAAETGRQLGDVETLLAGLWARNADAQAQADRAGGAIQATLAAVDEASARTAASLAAHTGQIESATNAALDRTASALDATRDGVHAQTDALLAMIEQARVTTDQIGGEAARLIGQRLDRLIAAAEQLGQQLAEQDARSRMMIDAAERSFMILDAKLQNATNTSNAALDSLAERAEIARDAIHQLGAPLAETHGAMLDLEELVERLRVAGGGALTLLGQEIPATATGLGAISEQVVTLHAATARVAEPVAAGEAAIAGAAIAFAEQRAALDSAALRLTEQLDAARAMIGEVEGQTENAAIASAQRLIEVLGRVREVAAATAGTMQETLAGVVAEAEAALDRAGADKAESAFGAPVRIQIAAIEETSTRAAAAAQAAAERVTQRLVGLAETVAVVEARIDEADTRYDVRLREDLARRSQALIESLNETSIDIAKLLAVDVGDREWDAYLKGDRSIFARRTVRLIDGGTARAIQRHFKHDPAFREQVTRYIDEFETLMRRVMPDREGKALAITLLSSDVGKLYVALAQAIERLR